MMGSQKLRREQVTTHEINSDPLDVDPILSTVIAPILQKKLARRAQD